MARLPKPTAQKIAEGNRGKRPLNIHDEPRPEAIKDLSPPAWLSPTAKKIWAEDIPSMSKVNLVTKADRYSFAVLCQETANYIDAQIQINALIEKAEPGKSHLLYGGKDGKQPQPHPLLVVQAMSKKSIISISREFGKTPVGRKQLAMAAQQDIFNDLAPSLDSSGKPASSFYN